MQLSNAWLFLLREVYSNGTDEVKDDNDFIREKVGNYLYINAPTNRLYCRPYESANAFLVNTKRGFNDIPNFKMKGEALYDYINSLNDPNMNNHISLLDNKSFVYTYPERLCDYVAIPDQTRNDTEYGACGYNQIEIMEDRLLNHIGSNRAVAVLYNTGFDERRKDIPCLNWLQTLIRNRKVELHCMFRSNDIYGAFPANMMFLTYLGMKITDDLNQTHRNLTFAGIHYHSSSAHIYGHDIPAVEKILGG